MQAFLRRYSATIAVSLLTAAVVATPPVAAHVTKKVGHTWKHLRPLVVSEITWGNLKQIPTGFADGVDNTGGAADDLSCTACVQEGELAFDPTTQSELSDHKASGDHDSRYWKLDGNALSGTEFLGSTNNQALNFRVNNQRVLRLEPQPASPNIIGGFSGNTVGAGVQAATISGGGVSGNINQATDNNGTIGGGQGNQTGNANGNVTDADYATVGGGIDNTASGGLATVSGGDRNTAGGQLATVGGGILNVANGPRVTVGGGESNSASGGHATVAGGQANSAGADLATVAGGSFNSASSPRATVGGGAANAASAESSTVSGGGSNTASGVHASVGGGAFNTASGSQATVGGGGSNDVTDHFGTVGGGTDNQAGDATGAADTARWATVGGGGGNTASAVGAVVSGGGSSTASGFHSTIAGGLSNTASGDYATVPGGLGHLASGHFSFAAGRGALATHNGAFMWVDSCNNTAGSAQCPAGAANLSYGSTAVDQFSVRATGGVRFVTAVDASAIPTAGATLAPGASSWGTVSDRASKENVAPVDGRIILDRLSSIPVATWNWKTQHDSIRHIGPMAQDFYAAFGVGEDEKHITTVDADGVALAAIQGLNEKVTALEERLNGGSGAESGAFTTAGWQPLALLGLTVGIALGGRGVRRIGVLSY